jgi:hypothetical protein
MRDARVGGVRHEGGGAEARACSRHGAKARASRPSAGLAPAWHRPGTGLERGRRRGGGVLVTPAWCC